MRIGGRTFAVVCAALVLAAAAPAHGRPPPRDIDGVWTNGWYTTLERPQELKSLVVTPAEAEAYEAPRRALHGMTASKPGEVGQAESEFNDEGPGLARIRGEARSSWIVDPPDGKIPWIPAQKARLHAYDLRSAASYDNVEERHPTERCLALNGATAPILNAADTNYFKIVQTPRDVVIFTEKNHSARIVRMTATRPPGEPRSWTGSSIGHWEGPTLVVETTGLRRGDNWVTKGFYLTDHARVVERFTRTGPRELSYLFTVEDPTLFTRPWRGEMVFRATDKPLFEYACHEGNYSLPAMLEAARRMEKPQAEAAR